jgi:hypothetical protein
MPKWASRIKLLVKRVWVERVRDISEDDAKAEGVKPVPFTKAGRHPGEKHAEAFEMLWISIYGENSWDENEWVWACEFEVIQPETTGD